MVEQACEWTRWVRIDLAAIRHNYRQIRSRLQPHVRFLAVVKGDAYGHGAVEVSRLMEEMGADMLGVTTVEEGLHLRREGITLPILVFSPFLPEEADYIVENDLTATIAGMDAIAWLGEAAQRQQRQCSLHLKIETGMGRTGLWPAQIKEAVQAIERFPFLELSGIYSHLAVAAWPKSDYTEKQFGIFCRAMEELDKLGYPRLIKHIANSAALLKYPHMHLDMVRAGTLLYGQYPAPELAREIALQDPWNFEAKVSYIRDLPAGHSVGYGRTFIAKRPTRVAVLPVGFSDGLQMEPVLKPVGLLDLLKGIAKLILLYLGHPRMDVPVIFPGGRGRIIGKVGMQLSMVDITGIPGVEIGTVGRLPLRRTAVNPCIPRCFVDNQQLAGESWHMENNN